MSSVVRFPGNDPEEGDQSPMPRGTVLLSALIILVNGAVKLAQVCGAAAILLLAGLGLVTLLGR
jgi:hypothetical protein